MRPRQLGTKRRAGRLVLALSLVLAMLAAACGGDDVADDDKPADKGSDATKGGDDTFGIAVILPSAKNDLAFSQSMVDALERVGEDRDIEVSYTDNAFVVEDAAAAMRDYASSGDYKLIIAHGSQYGATIEQLAPEFPDVSFAWGTAVDTFGLPNVFSYEAATDEGGYVQGVMAAALSKSGVLGLIGPVEVGDAKLYSDGFTAGAKAQDPDISVTTNWIGSFSDVSLAAEAAKGFASQGADAMSGTAQMVVGAIGVAKEQGIAWFGNDVDQSSLAEDIVVSAQVYHWETLLDDILEDIDGGTLGGEVYGLTLENEGLVIAFNDGFDLPDDVRELGEKAIEGIKAGDIDTGAKK